MGPNHFGRVTIILDGTNLFWSGTNHFGQVQTKKFSSEKSNLNLTKMIWTQPKRFVPNQKNCYSTNIIWSVQNHFGPIKDKALGINPPLIRLLYE